MNQPRSSEPGPNRPTWAEIDLDALIFNFRSSKEFIGDDVKYMAVVKADAYGHGAVPCARRLESAGVDWFGVALPEEGVELRQAGMTAPILCLGGFWLGQEELILNSELTPVIFTVESAVALNSAAKLRDIKAGIHVKIDTGMGRLGARWDQVSDFISALEPLKNLRVEALMTHFAVADRLEEDFTDLQIDRFNICVEQFENRGFHPDFVDLANSPGAVAHPRSRPNMVRLGGIIYGLGGDVLPSGIEVPELRPVMSLHSRIGLLKKVPAGEKLGYAQTFKTERDSLIATVPIGYHDGYQRILSNRARVIINGAYAPVVGRVSMDWITVDATDVPNPRLGDEVVLIGRQSQLEITAEELARLSETLSYEITCGISRRVPRRYITKRSE